MIKRKLFLTMAIALAIQQPLPVVAGNMTTTGSAITDKNDLITVQPQQPTKKKKFKIRYVKADVLNVRVRPTTKSKAVAKLHFNNKIKVISDNKKWLSIMYKGKKRYVCKKYTSKKKNKRKRYIEYPSPSSNSFKSYESGSCITNSTSIPQGRLKRSWRLDYNTGVYMVGDRYCVAVGSYYTTKIGTKIDLVLSKNGKTHVLKCILADCKADKDTVNNHRIHSDGSVTEFVVNTSYLPRQARRMGDVSYASSAFAGKIVKIRVYK